MKAEVVHSYGGPENMKTESYPDPVAGPGELLIRVVATSVNPVDIKRISGEAKQMFPLNFPDIVGADVSGTVEALGLNVKGFAIGDRVFAMAQKTYAELCVVSANAVAKIPDGLDIIEAARVPLVATTGHLAMTSTMLLKGQTVLITGATGAVGRSAVFTAKTMGVKIIAAVRAKHLKDAQSLGADRVVATDDGSLDTIEKVDAVVDLTGGETAEKLMSKIKDGGSLVTVLTPPKNAKDFAKVKAFRVQAQADAATLAMMGQALTEGKFDIPIEKTLKMSQAPEAQKEFAKGGMGKVLLVN